MVGMAIGRPLSLLLAAIALAGPLASPVRARLSPPPLEARRWPFAIGVNIKRSPRFPWGSQGTRLSLERLRRSGADAVAIVVFLWQPTPDSTRIVLGRGSTDGQVLAAIRQARQQGLAVVLKPQVWVPGSWAGAIDPGSARRTALWTASYRRALVHLARLAAIGHARMLAVGTEVEPPGVGAAWPSIIRAVRRVYHGKLTFVAHGLSGVERFPDWKDLDAVSMSVYPSLPEDPFARQSAIANWVARARSVTAPLRKPVWIAEIGIRSASGSVEQPWQSPEQRTAPVDLAEQTDTLAQWLLALRQPWIAGVLLWCWYTDPDAGGPHDTDFTIQNKPAQALLGGARLPMPWEPPSDSSGCPSPIAGPSSGSAATRPDPST